MKRKPKNSISLEVVRRHFPKVERIINAERPVIVEVTQHDDAIGTMKNHQTCALAVACKRAFKADGAIIGLTTTFIIKGATATRYHNAGTVSREVVSFDRKGGFDTGFYRLCVPPRNTHPKPTGWGRKQSGQTGGKASFRHYTRNVRTTLAHGSPGF